MNPRKKIWIVLSCIVLILGAFGYSYFTTVKNMINEGPEEKPGRRMTVKESIDPYIQDEDEGVSKFPPEDRVSPSTILIEKIISINTGCSDEYKQEVPEEIVDFTEEQVKEYYKEYDSVEFSTEAIVIVKRVPYLPNHFVVKLEGKYIKVYSTDLDGKAIIDKSFPEILCKNKDNELVKGIEVDSLDEVWQRIADYE